MMRPHFSCLVLALLASIIDTAQASPIYFADTGNYYELIAGSPSWDDARASANSLSYLGSAGHLANITSAAENAFITANFSTGENNQLAWIGGYDPTSTQTWIWADGPEAGIQFATAGTATAPFFYANWGGVEPNNAGSHTSFNIGNTFAGVILNGSWADSHTPSVGDPIVGYIVEYETTVVPEPSSLALLLSAGMVSLFAARRHRRR